MMLSMLYELLVIPVNFCFIQMLAALYHMHDCGVLHADIKPDNILVNARHNAVKVGWQMLGLGSGPLPLGVQMHCAAA